MISQPIKVRIYYLITDFVLVRDGGGSFSLTSSIFYTSLKVAVLNFPAMPTPTIEELLEEIQSLKLSLSTIEAKERLAHKNKYDLAFSDIRNAVLKTKDIGNVIENTYEKLGISDLFGDLIIVNNPYSDKLGFKFAEIIEERVNDILLSDLPDDPNQNGKKNRFLRIIKKVINNPIADVILKSNPIGAVVGNVINTATNLIDTTWKKVETTAIGNGLKKIALTTKDEIANEKLQLFKDSIEKYSNLYSQMLAITQKFDTRIDIIRNSFRGIFISHKDLYLKFISEMDLDVSNPFDGLDELFKKEDSISEDFDHQKVMQDARIQRGLEFLVGLPDVEAEASKYSDEFAITLKTFIEDYITVLKIPVDENWNPNEIDTDRLNDVIDKFNSFLNINTQVTTIPTSAESLEIVAMVNFSDNLSRFVA